jgi:hypothetical protein
MKKVDWGEAKREGLNQRCFTNWLGTIYLGKAESSHRIKIFTQESQRSYLSLLIQKLR